MGVLEEIAAAHPDRASEKARDKERAEFAKRMKDAAHLADGRRGAMRAAKEITGKVIFPGRWDAEETRDRTYGYGVRCWTRWERLRLVCMYFGPNDRGWPTYLFTVEHAGESAKVTSQADLAAALRRWGLV
jgi:hypothetical protein